MPKMYRKKPVVIEAIQVDFGYTNTKEVSVFVGDSFVNSLGGKLPYIKTLEGNMCISDGDYIIKGIQGEFYPCKPDIFEASYEEVDSRAEFSSNEQAVIHALMNIYCFTVTEAASAFNDDKVRDFLFANLERMAVGHMKSSGITFNTAFVKEDVDIERIAKRIQDQMKQEQKSWTKTHFN